MRLELAALGRSLGIPLIHTPPILVPNLTPAVKLHIGIIIKYLVRQTKRPRWEREALISNIRIVKTVPFTPIKIFQKFSNDFCKLETPPECHCDSAFRSRWHLSGQLIRINEHYALIPVSLSLDGTELRPKDALPVVGHKSREVAVKCLKQLAEIMHIQLPDLNTYLPHRL